MSEWRGIETAPRDGTQFIAYGSFPGFQVLRYAGENGTPGDYGPFIWATPDSVVSVWAETVPTHWMPLPAPPAPTQSTSKVARE